MPQYKGKLEAERLKMGFVGKIFGSGENVPLNIAAFVCLFSFAGLLLSWFIPSRIDPQYATQLFVGLIMASLGYIFGKSR